MPIKPNELLSHGTHRRQQAEPQQDGVASPTFRMAASNAAPNDDASQSLPVGIIAGAAAGGCALIAVVIVLAVVARKRRQEKDEQSTVNIV